MFCSNCGKEIMDSAKFCNFCGIPISKPESSPILTEPEKSATPITEVTETAAMPEMTAEPASTPINIFDGGSPQNTEGSPENTEILSEPATSEDTTPTEPVTAAYSSLSPEQIPTFGTAQPSYQPMPQTNFQQTPQPNFAPAPPVEQARPERKYTFAHIMMCLGAVAVMAIVAGIFAGLYFFSA